MLTWPELQALKAEAEQSAAGALESGPEGLRLAVQGVCFHLHAAWDMTEALWAVGACQAPTQGVGGAGSNGMPCWCDCRE